MLHVFRTHMVTRHLVPPVSSEHAHHLSEQVEKKHMPALQTPDAPQARAQRGSKHHATLCLLLAASKSSQKAM